MNTEINPFELSEEDQNLLDSVLEEIHQEIPSNSKTLNIDVATSRFSSAIWYENIQKKNITLAGIGGIGSFVCFLLARMKPASIYIYDDDRVEAVNMSGQLYSLSNIGFYKTQAMNNMLKNYANYYNLFTVEDKYTKNSPASNIMICGFDNMEARKCFFTNWVNYVQSKPNEERTKCLFIDGRLASEEFQILCIRGEDDFNMKRYKREFLFSDDEAEETICSYKQTTFCANMIASYIVNLFVNFCAIEVGAYRELPFYSTYNAETMQFKIED